MLRFDPTPNPNAIKVTLPVSMFGTKSVSVKKGETTEQPLLAAVMEIPGVDNVFAYGDFFTISKETSAAWEEILPKVDEAYQR